MCNDQSSYVETGVNLCRFVVKRKIGEAKRIALIVYHFYLNVNNCLTERTQFNG